jgi:hypothetical protein
MGNSSWQNLLKERERPPRLTRNKETHGNSSPQEPIGSAISGMQRAHIIHAHIALHKFDVHGYSSDIGSKMVRPGNQGAAYRKATEDRKGELVVRRA